MPLLHTLGGLACATAAAFLFQWLGVPLAYILGAMAGAALYANIVGPLAAERPIRRVGQLIIGTGVVTILTPAVLDELLDLFPLMIAVAAGLNLAAMLLAAPVARIAGCDRLTALLSCLPAGMSEMASLARDLGAEAHIVAWMHTLRVVLVVSALPLLIEATGTAASGGAAGLDLQSAPILAGFVLIAGVTAWLATRVGLLNPWVIAPMLLGLLLVNFGLSVPRLPPWLLILAQLAIGTSLGSRFDFGSLTALPRATIAGILSALVLIALAPVGLARLLEATMTLSYTTFALAVAPGGLGEMISTAKALAVAPATVAGFQFTRAVMTNLLVPLFIKYWVGRQTP